MRVQMGVGLGDHEDFLATLDTTGERLQPVVVPLRDPRFLEVAIGDGQPLTKESIVRCIPGNRVFTRPGELV